MDWNKFYEFHRKQPSVLDAEKMGFEIFHSGGGCSALRRDNLDGTTYFITCPDDAEIPSHDFPETFIGHYTTSLFDDGAEEPDKGSHTFDTLAAALEFIKGTKS